MTGPNNYNKSYLGGAGECHFIDVMVIDKCCSSGRSIAWYYVYHARRESRLQQPNRFMQRILVTVLITMKLKAIKSIHASQWAGLPIGQPVAFTLLRGQIFSVLLQSGITHWNQTVVIVTVITNQHSTSLQTWPYVYNTVFSRHLFMHSVI